MEKYYWSFEIEPIKVDGILVIRSYFQLFDIIRWGSIRNGFCYIEKAKKKHCTKTKQKQENENKNTKLQNAELSVKTK